MKDKRHDSVVNIGLTSLLLVFLVLCLTTFALLSLSSAKSDASLSEKLAAHRMDYYTASSLAEGTLADIDAVMAQTWKSCGPEEYLPTLTENLAAEEMEDITMESEDGSMILYYQVPVDESQTLFVRLRITDPSTSEHYYEILTWQVGEKKE